MRIGTRLACRAASAVTSALCAMKVHKSVKTRPVAGHRQYMQILKLDEAEVARRRAYFELGDDDLARLESLRPFAERHTHAIVEDFYALLLAHLESRTFFPDDATIRGVKRTQSEYFEGLFAGRCDLAYVEDRLRVGVAHERIGVSPKLYLGAYRRYLHLILEHLTRDFTDAAVVREAFMSIQKIVYFDMALAMDAYFAAHLETFGRQQRALRELSTPVTRVHDQVLLLPLVGTIDGARASQVMETVLLAVTEEQALAVIIDIAGVPFVDTQVADHLLKTTAAVRLLGAETILTGISPPVARTMVELGVDISSMHTVSRLSDGIEVALRMVGEQMTSRRGGPASRR